MVFLLVMFKYGKRVVQIEKSTGAYLMQGMANLLCSETHSHLSRVSISRYEHGTKSKKPVQSERVLTRSLAQRLL